MTNRLALLCLVFISFNAWAQPEQSAEREAARDLPEEVIVTGRRSVMQLRLQMWEAEVAAYEIFNRFNDDERFMISCDLHEPTGTRIKRQVCQTNFELEATREHALAYLGVQPETRSMEATIAAQQQAYRDKIRAVAETHPEFLDAVIRYTEVRARFENATRTGQQD